MSGQPARALRHERRAAALAARREARRADGSRSARRGQRVGPGIGRISAFGIAGGLLIVVALLIFGAKPAPTAIAITRASAPAGIATAGYVLGSATAPVTIDLYEDFQCPACRRWGENVFPSIARGELAAGTVRIAFHSFAFIGPESDAAGRAAFAAGEQGRFWDMWATLYANQGTRENGGAFSRDRLLAMADALDLDPGRFVSDLDSAAAAAWVVDGATAATAAGVSSTPTVFVNGQPLASSSYPDVAAAIAAAAPAPAAP